MHSRTPQVARNRPAGNISGRSLCLRNRNAAGARGQHSRKRTRKRTSGTRRENQNPNSAANRLQSAESGNGIPEPLVLSRRQAGKLDTLVFLQQYGDRGLSRTESAQTRGDSAHLHGQHIALCALRGRKRFFRRGPRLFRQIERNVLPLHTAVQYAHPRSGGKALEHSESARNDRIHRRAPGRLPRSLLLRQPAGIQCRSGTHAPRRIRAS